MKLVLVQSKINHYRIISHSTRKHPVLIQIASLLKQANKLDPLKIGIYNVYGGLLSTHMSVYSYISDKTDKMSRKEYYKWMAGNKQIKGKKLLMEWGEEEIDFIVTI